MTVRRRLTALVAATALIGTVGCETDTDPGGLDDVGVSPLPELTSPELAPPDE